MYLDYWSAGGSASVARHMKRLREVGWNCAVCLSVTRPHFFANFSLEMAAFSAFWALQNAARRSILQLWQQLLLIWRAL